MNDRKPEAEELEALEDEIQQARRHADEALTSPFHSDSHYYDSGDHPEDDDQTIAPPG
jgi:hypothetical protein